LEENLAQKKELINRIDQIAKNKADATKAAEEIKNQQSTPGLLTPDELGAEIRAELKKKIEEGYEMDEKLARRIRRM
jgi:metal-dependent amidase/aminoacylase/carboxypeptidase family protein